MNIVQRKPSEALRLCILTAILGGLMSAGGCASKGRLATVEERAQICATLQQYDIASNLSGQVELQDRAIYVKDGQANVAYVLANPRVQVVPLRMRAKLLQTDMGWRVLSNKPQESIAEINNWLPDRIAAHRYLQPTR